LNINGRGGSVNYKAGSLAELRLIIAACVVDLLTNDTARIYLEADLTAEEQALSK